MVEVEERDRIRNFQPPISGEEIMNVFELKPCREIGIIKEFIKKQFWMVTFQIIRKQLTILWSKKELNLD